MRRTALLVFVLVLAATGCGTRTSPVEGVVVYADAPETPATDLAGYVVTFESDGEGRERASATGTVEADGTFRVSTFKDGDGALRGRQRIAITPPILDSGSSPPSKVHPRHHDLNTSGLTAEIGPGATPVKLVVERAAKVK